MGNAHRQRPHDCGPRGALQSFSLRCRASATAFAFEDQLLSLYAERDAAKRENQSHRREDTQDKPPACPGLSISLVFRAGDRQDVPGPSFAGIDARKTGESRPRGNPKAAASSRGIRTTD